MRDALREVDEILEQRVIVGEHGARASVGVELGLVSAELGEHILRVVEANLGEGAAGVGISQSILQH